MTVTVSIPMTAAAWLTKSRWHLLQSSKCVLVWYLF